MGILRFSDGVNINTSGEYRIIHLHDGYYVTGKGVLIPVDSLDEGKKILKELKSDE